MAGWRSELAGWRSILSMAYIKVRIFKTKFRFFTKPWPHPIKTIENSVYLVIVDFYLLLLGCGLPWKLLYVKTLKQSDKKNNFKCWKLQTNSEDTVLKILQLSWLLLTKLSVVHLAVLPCKTIGKYCNYSSQLHYDWFFTALLT